MEEYLISFSSFYKAAYAQDILSEAGISGTLRRLPTELMRSCSTGLYLRSNDIQEVRRVLSSKSITNTGIYKIIKSRSGAKEYIKIR
ncbi:MAG: DUF3343 domain-containing protein [Firmicutes bacterium]|nr:DUF3343 domain-containing protein [Bacillota bacterium]